ncbi:MAG: Pimeloyl-(acyl-carrier protein) methyl ester esterase [Alphaproteobacteria bacterium ADurb.BinA280]|jgi:pimeloyl-[acyl-carrier protein] methyl ester esterase|nr:MAG: Pimeloyl-(acyl-carrier protein) methyl ester esterase [Alphaproteobacteria bacterium ADurb.BinA280]
MHVEVVGSGRPLVLLHGWAMHGGVFAPLVEQLRRDHVLYLVDLPGHGLSTERDAIDLAHVVQRIAQVTPAAVWLGWSLGGLLAQQAALEMPWHVRGLIAVAASPRFVTAPDWDCAVSAEVFAQFGAELKRDYRGTLERFLMLEAAGSQHAQAEIRALRECVFARGEPAQMALQQGLSMLSAMDLRAELAHLTQAHLWIAGRRDKLVPWQAMQSASASTRRGSTVCIAGAGHAPFLSHAVELATLVRQFVQASDNSAPST